MDITSIIRQNQDKDAMLKRSLNTLVNLYTDKTHFIYELLQNAEDAHASSVFFIQHNDCFEMIHDGLPFTQSNAQAICDAANSDKVGSNDTNIGKFGVGFKAVFAICSIVKLYSEPANRPIADALPRFAFEIQDYTNPIPINDEWTINASFTTRFVFPYDHQGRYRSVSELRRDIAKKLQSLGADVMLFLKYIEGISYEIINVDDVEDSNGLYMLGKEKLDNDYVKKITALGENNERNQDLAYLMYSKPIGKKSVDIVFSIDNSGEKPVFLDASEKHRHISVYFPTETESKLKFVVQAPFITTPNRGGVPIGENSALVNIECELLREAVLDVKRRGWLTLEFLNLLPFVSPNGEWLFEPMYDTTVEMFKNEEILPTIDGSYTSMANANIARGESLTEIFKGGILCKLLNNENAVWLPTTLTENNKSLSGLVTYLNRELRIPLRRAEDLPKLLTGNVQFLKSMSDEWLERFYIYLSDDVEALLKGNDFAKTPFVKLANGNFYAPFIINGKDRTSNVFIFPKNATRELTGFNFVADFIHTNCVDFIKVLGITEPDGYDYFVQELKNYQNETEVDDEINIQHVKTAIRYLKEYRPDAVKFFKKYLRLNCVEPNGNLVFTTAESCIYYKTDKKDVSIWDYLADTESDVYLLNEEFYKKNGINIRDLQELEQIGVLDCVYNYGNDSWYGNYSSYCSNYGEFKLHLDFKHISEVLVWILNNSKSGNAVKKSKIIFDLIKNVEKHLKGCWRYKQTNPDYIQDTAKIVKTLRNQKWIFSKNGELVKSGDISRYELNMAIYGKVDENSEIYDILGFAKNGNDENFQLFKQIINMDTSQFTNVIRNLPEDIKNALILELVNDIEDDSDEFDPNVVNEDEGFPDESIKDLIRLKDVTKKRYESAPSVQYIPKLLRIRVSQGKDRENIGNRYKGYCQMCVKPSQFWEVAEIFNNPTKELEFMNLSLCPTCASKYRRLRNDKIIMANFANNIRSSNVIDPSAIVGEDCITFTKAHLVEIQMVLELDKSIIGI